MIFLYKIICIILIPIIKLNIRLRIKKNKELLSRHKERYGYSNLNAINNNNLIWIHAASIGEFKSADYFINKYHKEYTLLITTTTVSAANYANDHYADKITHQFAPLDIDIWVNRFLNHWKPKFIIWIESDLWPNTLNTIKKRGIKAILVNARLSPQSLKRWRLIPSFYNELLNSFSLILAQSKIDQKRINLITKRNIKFIGNLKLTPKNFNLEKNQEKITRKNSNITRIMLTSTHEKEESLLIPIIENFLKKDKNLQLIIAPRHIERSKQIFTLCAKYNISCQLESAKNKNSKDAIIIDTFGILSNNCDWTSGSS